MKNIFSFKKLSLIFILITLIVYLISNNKLFQKQVNSNNIITESTNETTSNITSTDIDEGKKVIEDYFNALKTSDTIILKNYLGYYMVSLSEIGACNVNGDNAALAFLYDNNFKPELIKISATPKHEINPLTYANDIKNQNNIDVYKIMALNVQFNYLKERDWDFILVKYNETNPWKIHMWIENKTSK